MQVWLVTFAIWVLGIVSSSGSFVDSTTTHSGDNLRKRSLDTCVDYFDVKKAHVVHVGKSEALGGRLLNSSTGVSRISCLQKCCQTDRCTVASYDERSPSNCYLFDCGDSDDFRCALVSYSDFESAILSVSRQQLKYRMNALPATFPSVVIPGKVCRHNEFQCKTSKECIAGYDRCNGAYECPDRSDEENCDEYRQEQYRLATIERENEENGQLLEDRLRTQNNADNDQDNLWDRGRNRAAPEANTIRWDPHPDKNVLPAVTKGVLISSTLATVAAVTPSVSPVPLDRISTTIPIITSPDPQKIDSLHVEKSDGFPVFSWINFSDPSHFVVSTVLIMAIVFCAGVTLFVICRWLCSRQKKVTKYRIVDPDAEDFLLGGSYG